MSSMPTPKASASEAYLKLEWIFSRTVVASALVESPHTHPGTDLYCDRLRVRRCRQWSHGCADSDWHGSLATTSWTRIDFCLLLAHHRVNHLDGTKNSRHSSSRSNRCSRIALTLAHSQGHATTPRCRRSWQGHGKKIPPRLPRSRLRSMGRYPAPRSRHLAAVVGSFARHSL